jgi:uncharacterized protein
MVFNRIRAFIYHLLSYEKSPTRLAFTCALGIYIGASPLVGLHTILVFLVGWLCALSIPVLFTVSIFIHNPWTMMPIYAFEHFFGRWLFRCFNSNSADWDPQWVESCNDLLYTYTGIKGISLSAFFIGGNVIAITASLLLYPIMRYIFTRYVQREAHGTALKVLYKKSSSRRWPALISCPFSSENVALDSKKITANIYEHDSLK